MNINKKKREKMKNIFTVFMVVAILSCCSPKEEKENALKEVAVEKPQVTISDDVYSFDINSLSSGCDVDSEIVCAINNTIKCTINPKFAECAEYKNRMPSFIFMEDESLKRPTSQSYELVKMKSISENMVEVYTKGTCNGNWFGLCNGGIIYVMTAKDGHWAVSDIYAIEMPK